MTNKETVRLYLNEELKDSIRSSFNLTQMSKDSGIELDDLTLALKLLVMDRIISVFEQENPDEVFIELQL